MDKISWIAEVATELNHTVKFLCVLKSTICQIINNINYVSFHSIISWSPVVPIIVK